MHRWPLASAGKTASWSLVQTAFWEAPSYNPRSRLPGHPDLLVGNAARSSRARGRVRTQAVQETFAVVNRNPLNHGWAAAGWSKALRPRAGPGPKQQRPPA